MNLGRIGLLALALCLALIADSAQSQRRPQQVRVKRPTATDVQPRSSDQSPLIVKIAPTPKADEERAEEAKERERMAESERKKEKSDADLEVDRDQRKSC